MAMRSALRRVGLRLGAPARPRPGGAAGRRPGSTAPTSGSATCNSYPSKTDRHAKFDSENCGEWLPELFQFSACVNWIESTSAMSE